MPINFIPNDPLAQGAPPLREQRARRNRPASRATVTLPGAVPQRRYQPFTPEFLFWQAREAALQTLAAWEEATGNFTAWSTGALDARRLALLPFAGQDEPNAFYDRASFSFFEYTSGGKTTFSAASTDVVAHEVGHGLLDALRPDLWDANFTETGAFHEAFGDCVAILTALSDPATRAALLAATPDLSAANFVEATAEDLSEAIRVSTNPFLGPNHNASAPRHALNNFHWALPPTLPTVGGPAVLVREIHSFGRIFSGCFYDLIRLLFAASPQRDEAALWNVTKLATRLLAAAARQAPIVPRFFQSIGRTMVLADQTANGGANGQAIRQAFAGHNIALGVSAMLAPRAALAGAAPQRDATGAAVLPADTRRDLLQRLNAAPRARLAVNALNLGGTEVAEVVHQREVPLTGLSERLTGVVALAPEAVLVGAAGVRAAMLSALPEVNMTSDEVRAFVETLVDNDRIEYPRTRATTRRGAAAAVAATATPPIAHTHRVVTRGGKQMLERIRFLCGGGCRH